MSKHSNVIREINGCNYANKNTNNVANERDHSGTESKQMEYISL
jgi:hypothetical protein